MIKFLNVQDLDIEFGNRLILKDLSFSLAQGELLVVIGSNGIGKSTLLKTLTGLIKPLNGEIRFKSDLKIGVMPQLRPSETILPMTVSHFLSLFDSSEDWLNNLLTYFDLNKFLGLDIHDLSCGMWQRVNLVQALAGKPDLLFLDEPTAGLDIYWQSRVYKFLHSYVVEMQKSIICVSHDTLVTSNYANKVLCLDHSPYHVHTLEPKFDDKPDFILFAHKHEKN